MFRNIMLTALVAGALVGVVLTALQLTFTTPLILHAEEFENAGAAEPAAFPELPGEAHGDAAHNATPHSHGDGVEEEGWAPSDGLERQAFTGLATIVTSIGLGMLLTSLMVLWGGKIDGRNGLLWGLGGFAAMTLAPSLGLAPELPASAAAELGLRQVWWAGTFGATAGGLALMAFSGSWVLRLCGIALIAAPHIIGAPAPDMLTSTAPAELAAEFVGVTIALSGVFWALLGWSTGTFWHRLTRDPGLPA